MQVLAGDYLWCLDKVTICSVFPHVYNCQVIENKLLGDTIEHTNKKDWQLLNVRYAYFRKSGIP